MNRLQQARIMAGLSLVQVRMGENRLIAFHETSPEPVPSEVLDQAAELYDVSRCWLLGHVGQPVPESLAQAFREPNASYRDQLAIERILRSTGQCPECAP
jgi:hypothetical protein